MKAPLIRIVAIVLFLVPVLPSAAPSATLLAESCTGCHGSNGHSQGQTIPSIVGYPVSYFIKTMQAFKSGDRPSTVMGRIAKGYNDEEIKAMAAFFTTRPYISNAQTLNKGRVEQGKPLYVKHCQSCHGKKGNKWSAGAVGGQWLPYLQYSLQDFMAGQRTAPDGMMNALKTLSPGEQEAILNYAASLR